MFLIIPWLLMKIWVQVLQLSIFDMFFNISRPDTFYAFLISDDPRAHTNLVRFSSMTTSGKAILS